MESTSEVLHLPHKDDFFSVPSLTFSIPFERFRSASAPSSASRTDDDESLSVLLHITPANAASCIDMASLGSQEKLVDPSESPPLPDIADIPTNSIDLKVDNNVYHLSIPNGQLCPHQRRRGCTWNAVRSCFRSLLYGFAVKGALSVVAGLINRKLIKQSRRYIRISAIDACRFGMLTGCFVGIFKALLCMFRRLRSKDDWKNSFIAGAIGGVAILLDDPERRVSIALYALARVLGGASTSLVEHKVISEIPHMDVLLFSLCCSQIMHSYVLEPRAIPSAYYNFIVRMGPIHKSAIEFHRALFSSAWGPPNFNAINKFFESKGVAALTSVDIKDGVTAELAKQIYHPGESSCLKFNFRVFTGSATRALGFYLPVHTLPTLILRFKKLVSNPMDAITTIILGALRSSAFIGVYCMLYQGTVCSNHSLGVRPSTPMYVLAGAIAGLSLLVERHSRRSELALWVLPRAIQAAFYMVCKNTGLKPIHHGETLVFSFAMGALMTIYTHDQNSLGRVMRAVLRFTLGST